jgi:hypothetical protein
MRTVLLAIVLVGVAMIAADTISYLRAGGSIERGLEDAHRAARQAVGDVRKISSVSN